MTRRLPVLQHRIQCNPAHRGSFGSNQNLTGVEVRLDFPTPCSINLTATRVWNPTAWLDAVPSIPLPPCPSITVPPVSCCLLRQCSVTSVTQRPELRQSARADSTRPDKTVTVRISKSHPGYIQATPRLHPRYTQAAPGYIQATPGYIQAAPRLHQATSKLHPGYIQAAPRLHQVTSRLHPSCTQAARRLRAGYIQV
ncbi:hypothetical protein RRG08_039484 [Elysia crispata]|uniref:Uncharacterized protein n=1 Tax=Elysia crispata TaxID=231223 RepID=A0AAE1D0K7_9GAST|nr:hypothetical protein RRG08_039484 [Elysia crispata]